jgi:hypothetical protein
MGRTSRTLAALAGLALVVVLTGCSRPDTSPVPTTAESPYVCDGVPLEGAELTLAGKASVDKQSGSWITERPNFLCVLDGSGDRMLQIDVVESVRIGPTDEKALEVIEKTNDAEPIEADAPGAGYVTKPGAGTVAHWVCDGRYIKVTFRGDDVKGRNGNQDVENLLVSMLPWACGGDEVPEAS